MPTIYKELANQPAKRFYVSEKRAAVVVGKLMRGEDIGDMRPQRKEMFFEILRRVNELSKVRTNTSVSKLVAEVVAQPAPSFYLTEGSAKVIVCRIRRENRKKRNQRS